MEQQQTSLRAVPFITVDSHGAFQVRFTALRHASQVFPIFNKSSVQVHEEAAGIIRQIRGPVAVVAVAGLYRTGKSYLLNVLTNTIGQGTRASLPAT